MVKKFEFIKKAFLKVFFFIVAIVFLFFIANFRVSDYKKRLANAKLQLGTIELVKDLNNKIEVRGKLLATIQRGRAPVYGLLKLISTLIPKEMVLNELIFDRQNHSLVFKGIIEGGA
ncbi:MAG: hypothetical protein Q8O30_13500, partial [Candidatus Omnitrophota bacterium]|nr:hypothetical protein [Candidatus Omnitrophota bacterium]